MNSSLPVASLTVAPVESPVSTTDDVSRLRALLAKATGHGTGAGERPLPWRVWTSCSYRRVSSDATGHDGDVLAAYAQRGDGHLDLTMPEDRLAALVELINAIPVLLDKCERFGRLNSDA